MICILNSYFLCWLTKEINFTVNLHSQNINANNIAMKEKGIGKFKTCRDQENTKLLADEMDNAKSFFNGSRTLLK